MSAKCPGSAGFSQPAPEIKICPVCGEEIEIWTDEITAACSKCKVTIIREDGATCLDWCKYAKQCVGEKLYNKYLENKRRIK